MGKKTVEYNKKYEPQLITFLEKCLPQSGRALDISGRHSFYLDIANQFKVFWCLFEDEKIIGTVAAKEAGYHRMYLDSLSTSTKALGLYSRVGFVDTERYNQNVRSDVFKVLELK